MLAVVAIADLTSNGSLCSSVLHLSNFSEQWLLLFSLSLLSFWFLDQWPSPFPIQQYQRMFRHSWWCKVSFLCATESLVFFLFQSTLFNRFTAALHGISCTSAPFCFWVAQSLHWDHCQDIGLCPTSISKGLIVLICSFTPAMWHAKFQLSISTLSCISSVGFFFWCFSKNTYVKRKAPVAAIVLQVHNNPVSLLCLIFHIVIFVERAYSIKKKLLEPKKKG